MREFSLRTPIRILLVEDNPDDVFLMKKVLEKSRLKTVLLVVESGEEALRLLRREAPFDQTPRPHLILLDLLLPGISGLDVLTGIKADIRLRSIPVLILTNSENEDAMLAAYDLLVTAFIVKPGGRDEFEAVVGGIERFWLETAQLPQE